MRLFVLFGAAAALLATTTSALADDGPQGLELGLRLGYALPLGSATGSSSSSSTSGTTTTTVTTKETSLSDIVSGQLPIWVDAGYRINPNIYVGAFFQYGIAFVASNANTGCSQSGVSCSGHDIMFGVNAHYHFMPLEQFDPWIGLGVGYESLGISASANGQSSDVSVSGFQFVNVQLGADYKVKPNFGVGPFAAFSLGQFSSSSFSFNGSSTSQDITNKAMHEWLTLGVRGVYDISLM